jgi:hypothetical protein
MAAQKPLQLVSGVPTEVTAVDTSAGAGDAGKIVALDAAGLLASSMMPAGFGANVDTIASSENLSAGDFVNIYDNAGTINVRKADADNGRPAHGFVKAAVVSPANATVYGLGELNDQVSGLTVGADYFLSTTAGGVTTTAPSSSGAYVQFLGRAKSATALRFMNEQYFIRA